ncbi:WD repeat-containing protein [Termitomyces sp. J132]|nr:WD repeat-containing protein [Termitomyces sp. J132]
MVQYDKKLLWHPRGANRFIVGGGSQITLYEWAPNQPKIRQITSQHDLQHLKCLAWSPDPIFDDLVAVGNSSGRIELLRLEASRVSQRSNSLSSGQGIPLNVRNSRSCNSLAFCSVDPNYLASGFDKVRGDCSLILWDINTVSATLSLPLGQSSNHDVVKCPLRPEPIIPQADIGRGVDNRILQQYASTETVSVVSFLPQSTTLLLAGISYRWLRLFDLRSPVAATLNAASKVQGIATDPFDPHRIACFGDGVITVWDTRKLQTPNLTFTEKDASADGAQLQPNSIFSGLEFSSTRRGLLASMEREASYVRLWNVIDVNDDAPLNGSRTQDSVRIGRRSWANLTWPSGAHANQGPPSNQDSHGLILSDTRRTKTFARPLSSFALSPSGTRHPLTTNIMVVNKDGDLELYAIYDTPKPAAWSSRGNLAVGAGPSYRIVKAPRDDDVPEDMLQSTTSLFERAISTSRVGSRSREQSLLRGRQKSKSDPVVPPLPDQHTLLSGQGDREPFSVLEARRLSATRLHGDVAANEMERMQGSALGLSLENTTEGKVSRNHSLSGGRRTTGTTGVTQIVEDDISMVMKRRAMRGYGLFDPRKNLDIVQICDPPHHARSQILAQLWAWISHSYEYLCIPKPILHGFDFSYQGLLGIWEGITPLPVTQGPNLVSTNNYYDLSEHWESHPPVDKQYGNFSAALTALVERRDRPWKPPVATSKALHRQVALQLIGWTFREDDFTKVLQKWETQGELSKVACWLVFTKQHAKAISLLMKSSDESHCMLSGTIAALVPHGPKTTELREHCERLIVRLQDPYFRAILTHLALNDWSEVLEEEALPFRERLAVAFQFLDDKAVTSYLRRCQDRAINRGDIDAIIIPGLSSKAGMDILQGFVNRTGDVQSAAIMGSFVYPPRNPHQIRSISVMERRVERWVESYRDLLDGFKMFHRRVEFDIERGQIALKGGAVNVGDWVPKQVIIRCHYCNKSVIPDGSSVNRRLTEYYYVQPTACFHCHRSLPRCSICLMTLSIVRDEAREAELLHTHSSKDTMEDTIVMCQTCRHGGHVSHIIAWFNGQDGSFGHDVCAVADCDCHCAEEI